MKWWKSEFLKKSGVEIKTYIDGEGHAFVILPSYGRDSGVPAPPGD